MIQIMGCAQESIMLNLIILLIYVPMVVKLVELMLHGWPSQSTLEKPIFVIVFIRFWQHNRKNGFYNCLPHLNFTNGAFSLTLRISKPIFGASCLKKHRSRVQDHHNGLQIFFLKIFTLAAYLICISNYCN